MAPGQEGSRLHVLTHVLGQKLICDEHSGMLEMHLQERRVLACLKWFVSIYFHQLHQLITLFPLPPTPHQALSSVLSTWRPWICIARAQCYNAAPPSHFRPPAEVQGQIAASDGPAVDGTPFDPLLQFDQFAAVAHRTPFWIREESKLRCG